MAGKLILGVLLLSLASVCPGKSLPRTCPGCDCPADDCYTPECGCTQATTDAWCAVMLKRVQGNLHRTLGAAIDVKQPLRVLLTDPSALGGDGVAGEYQEPGRILLSRSLDRAEAVATLAHEVGHAWQAEHHPQVTQVDLTLREGFAEWVALQALRPWGEGGEALRSNQDPAYGGGLRWFLQVEREYGRPAVFQGASTWLDVQGARSGGVAP